MAKPRSSNRKKRKGAAPGQRKRRPQLPLEEMDWKNYPQLRRFLSERGKIRSRRITGLSRRQQSRIARAVKRAREMGLIAYPDQDRRVPKSSQTVHVAPVPAAAAPPPPPPVTVPADDAEE